MEFMKPQTPSPSQGASVSRATGVTSNKKVTLNSIVKKEKMYQILLDLAKNHEVAPHVTLEVRGVFQTDYNTIWDPGGENFQEYTLNPRVAIQFTNALSYTIIVVLLEMVERVVYK